MCKKSEVLTYDWIKTGGRSRLVNALIAEVGCSTNFSDFPTNQDLVQKRTVVEQITAPKRALRGRVYTRGETLA